MRIAVLQLVFYTVPGFNNTLVLNSERLPHREQNLDVVSNKCCLRENPVSLRHLLYSGVPHILQNKAPSENS